MSSTKPLRGTRSFSIVRTDTTASVVRISRHQTKLRKFIPTMVLRLTVEALGQFACDVACVIAESLIAALSWLLSEFLAGCATYAEAMYPIPIAIDERDSALNRAASQHVSPAPAATRLHLVVIDGLAQQGPQSYDQLPTRQATGASPMTHRDWAASQDIETIRPGRASATRRTNRPR
jgi:hypothetical protein